MQRLFSAILATLVLIGAGCGGAQGSKNAWKAVFLTSGQVYYGKLTHGRGQFYKLEDVYYIRVNNNTAAPQNSQESPEDKAKPKTPELALVKLGNEVHGPQDAIYLNRDHILYIEDLKQEGQVVAAIAEAKAAGASPAVAGQPPAPTPTATPTAAPGDEAEQFRQFQKFLDAQKALSPPLPAKSNKN